jgi:thioredoxin reductase (NADPH)
MTEEGCLAGNTPFGSNLPGFYAAGDVVEGLDQISVASGHGAIAGTKAHNWLREQDSHTLD